MDNKPNDNGGNFSTQGFTPPQPEQSNPSENSFQPQNSATYPEHLTNPIQPSNAGGIQPPQTTQFSSPSAQPISPIQSNYTPQTNQPSATIPQTATYGQFQPNGQPVVPGSDPNSKFFSSSAQITKPAKSRKKLFLASAISIGVLLIGAAGYVFGYYIPNKPENVWSTGLDRTGQAIEKLSEEALKRENIDKIDSTQLSGNLEIKSPDINFNGSMSLVYDPKKSKGDLRVTSNVNGDEEQKLQLDFMSEIVGENKYPDIFIKYLGVKEYTDIFGLSEVGDYENKWISISNEYLEKTLPTEASEDDEPLFNSQEVSEVTRIVIDTTNEYVFTTDPEKAVLNRTAIVGEEEVNGLNTYHYKVKLNEENAKKLCIAFTERIYDSEAARKVFFLDDENLEKNKKEEIESCNTETTEVGVKEEFDMWIDKKYKLIHKIRVTDKESDEIYTDFGQIYKGGDEVSFFLNYKDNPAKTSVDFTVTANFKNFETKGELIVATGTGDTQADGKFTFEVKPYEEEINIERPKNAIPIEKILEAFGLSDGGTGPTSKPGSIQSKAKDAERQTDINAIHAQLEAYYATNGFYPLSSGINNPTWVNANLIGLDKEALKDPDGSVYMLTDDSAISGMYGYDPSECDQSGCQVYKLTARLSDGELWTKLSLN